MLSEEKKFLFIHFPKTGGNSIQNLLKEYTNESFVIHTEENGHLERFNLLNKKYGTHKHSVLARYYKELDKETFNRLFKFSVIRNPWDRAISYYFSPSWSLFFFDKNTFKKVLERVPKLKTYICINQQKHIRPIDSDIDFLMRFENLEEDYKKLCNKLNIPYKTLPKVNSSKRLHYSKYYDDELVELVRKKFEDEIKFGNYKFERK